MSADLPITNVAHVIQLAVAPVFLLTGIGAFLSVLTTRVSRIVDRARQLNVDTSGSHGERCVLARRARLANWAISLCISCALLICALIVVLFVGAFLSLNVSAAIALLFVSAMLALIAGLLCFLREIHMAIASQRLNGGRL